MKSIVRFAILLSSFILVFSLAWWFISNQEDGELAEKESDKETLNVTAMNELMAEDLSYTIQLFLHQMKEELAHWKSIDYEEETIKKEMEKEIGDHDHVFGFAHYINGQEDFKIGHMKENALESLTDKKEDGSLLSNPYVEKGKKRMLIGYEEKDEVFLCELDLSFIEMFIKDVASMSDSNGDFFVGGDDIDLSLSYEESESPFVTAEIPEIGWKLFVKSEESEEEDIHFREGEVIVKLAAHVDEDKWTKEMQVTILDEINGMIIVKSKKHSTNELMGLVEKDNEVMHAEPNFMYSKQETQVSQSAHKKGRSNYMPFQRYTIPNDEFYYPYQWNLDQIFAEEGWDITIGKEEVPIAIIDSGIEPTHLDLEAKIINGYNSFEDNGAYIDENGHGTHVAGIAAAITNNRDGIAGISWNNPILAVKSLDKEAVGSSLSIAKGIVWAVDQGAKVINLSLGDSHDSELMSDAIRYAYDRDVVLIAASGNENTEAPMYPAAYDEVLAVGAVNMNRERAIFSNFGDHLDLSAPGEHIPSTYLGNQYVVMSGTSMAAPHVTGMAGLLRSIDPKLTNDEIYDLIRKTSNDLGSKGYDPYYGHGEIDVENALKKVILKK